MGTDAEPTLADDEARLVEYATALGELLIDRASEWATRVTLAAAEAAGLAPDDQARAELDSIAAGIRAELAAPLAVSLASDVDAGAESPLALVRASVGPLGELLAKWGAKSPVRDEFARNAFPDDHFALGPANFSDIHPSLHEPGLIWGAARAHVHLRRRRLRSK